MVDDGLVQYIKERLGEGYKEDHIRGVLAEHGHDQASVDEAFQHIHRNSGHKLFLPILLILLIGLGVLLFFVFRPEATDPGTSPGTDPGTDIGDPTQSAATVAQQLKLEAQEKTADEVYYDTVQAAGENAGAVADGILLCSVNKDITYKNYCLQELAEEKREAAYCEVIGDGRQRDDCYLGLVFLGEDQYCSKLLLEENQRVCDILLGET